MLFLENTFAGRRPPARSQVPLPPPLTCPPTSESFPPSRASTTVDGRRLTAACLRHTNYCLVRGGRYGRDSLGRPYEYTSRLRRLHMYNGVRPRERGKGACASTTQARPPGYIPPTLRSTRSDSAPTLRCQSIQPGKPPPPPGEKECALDHNTSWTPKLLWTPVAKDRLLDRTAESQRHEHVHPRTNWWSDDAGSQDWFRAPTCLLRRLSWERLERGRGPKNEFTACQVAWLALAPHSCASCRLRWHRRSRACIWRRAYYIVCALTW